MLGYRQRRGLAQKAVALGCGLSQTVYCAIERGRRRNLQPETVGRIGAALTLSPEERADLAWAVDHDRLMDEMTVGPTARAAPLVSAALRAVQQLTPSEAAGLQDYIEELLAASQKLRAVDVRGTAALQSEEVTMT